MTLREKILKEDGLNPSSSYRDIAAMVNCSFSSVKYHLNRSGKEKINNVRRRQRNVKRQMASLKMEAGGKCARCEYDRCMSVLHFHHVDPSTKDRKYTGMRNILSTSSIGKAKIEMDKCILLCANCHGELHDGLWEYKVEPLVGLAPTRINLKD